MPTMSLIERLLGRTLATNEEGDQRIGPLTGVAVLGLDALSSAAYGPEAALTVLLGLGTLGLVYIGPITLLIVVLLFVVYLSYRQTITAYPGGGGSYTVARENLGVRAGLLGAAALLLDYVLNVAVGISAGVGAVISALPRLIPYQLDLCLLILVVLALVNLRGVREAGAAFLVPTLAFVGLLALVIVVGLVKVGLSGGHPLAVVNPPQVATAAASGAGLWLLVRAFASGCTALTGVEAVSNGVPAFRAPAPRNAQRSLTLIVGILALLLGGIAYLARAYGVTATDPASPAYQSVLSILIAAVMGKGVVYGLSTVAILAVLCLSANTSFADFPRVCRLLAHDDFLPHAFAVRGRRLVYTWGILVLTGLAGLLLIVFGGITDRLIPLFAIGAFLAFTMSQSGMVQHWRRATRGGWPVLINGFGALLTGLTLLVILSAKFMDGAWVTLLVIPAFLLLFTATRRHYEQVGRVLVSTEPLDCQITAEPVVVVPMGTWNASTRKALRFGMKVSGDVRAVYVRFEGSGDEVVGDWPRLVEAPAHAQGRNSPALVVLDSPYRQLLEPLIAYIEQVEHERPDAQVLVVIPELVEARWYHYFLHNQRATALKTRLYFRNDPRVVVANVPWYLHQN